jgi:type II secretory pathway pseudopilin PulG
MISKRRSNKKINSENLQEIAESYEKWGRKKRIIIISVIAIVLVSGLAVLAFNILQPASRESAEVARIREVSKQMSTVMRNERVIENMISSYRSRREKYPTELKLLTMDGKIKLPLGVLLLDSTKDKLNAENGKTTIWYQYSSDTSEGSGARIQYWDYSSNNISRRIIYLGDATKDSDFFDIK